MEVSKMAKGGKVKEEEEEEGYTKDGSVDLKGNPLLRSKTGGWKACSFIVVYELFERMAYYGIASNLVLYLARRLRMGTVSSANNVTNWVGTVFLMPVLGAYVADAHLGRYRTFVASSCIYLLGICMLTVAVSVEPFKTSECDELNPAGCRAASAFQVGVFFAALYILAIGTAGTKPNISTMGADQFDDFNERERRHKLSFFNWWMFSVFLGTLLANSVLVYIQDNVGWTLGYGLPAVGLALSILIFLLGTPFYRHKLPQGSPFTKMARVFVAAALKWRMPPPEDPRDLYELGEEEYLPGKGRFRIDPTNSLRLLNRAAVKDGEETPWRLQPVTHVEETKQMLGMIPIWCTMFIPSTMIAQINTLFVKQGTTLDRSVGPHFQIPPASLIVFITISMLATVVLYDRWLVKLLRRWTRNPRGISLLQRVGIGLVIQIVLMLIASLTETYRLRVAGRHGLVQSGGKVPLTIFILLPQFALNGVADAFLIVGSIEFFYDQAPESMKSLGTSYSLTMLGVGNFLSSFILSTVDKVTRKDGRKGWILDNLNDSHLDYYYAFLTLLTSLNFLVFLAVTRVYAYRAEVFEAGKHGQGPELEI